MENSSLSNIIKTISSSNSRERKAALIKLSEQIVFVPATSFEKKVNGEETKKIKIVHNTIDEKNVIPVFTQEDVFFDYISEHNYQCFSLPLGDLGLTAPAEYWIVIDPKLETEIFLSPDDIGIISGTVPLETEPSYEKPVEKDEDDYPIYADDYEDIPEDLVEEKFDDQSIAYKINTKILSADAKEVKDRLKQILDNYNEIVEAYYIHDSSGITALGLVSENLSLENRFNLIEEVANISREFFGEAGLIEVFDDLASYSSSSWELFKTITPFYEKQKVNKSSVPLSSQIEWSTLRNYEQQNSETPEEEEVEEEEEIASGFSLKNIKLFSKLKLGN